MADQFDLSKLNVTDNSPRHQLNLSSLAIHADDSLALTADVAPPIHVSTTFRYPGGHGNRYGESDPDQLVTAKEMQDKEPEFYVYSRHATPTTTRLEHILSVLLSPSSSAVDPNSSQPVNSAVTYASGQAAFHAALVHFQPKTLSVGTCYHGCKALSHLWRDITGMKIVPLDCPAEDLQPGDLIHLETPVNPHGTALSIASLAKKAHSRGAYLMVDSTFAPPPLQDPFAWGADIVMHSSTKYIGGHSDMLGGVLAVRHDYGGEPDGGKKVAAKLYGQRLLFGGVMGSLEGWLGMRSLRTFALRVERASVSATKLVNWLANLPADHPGKKVIEQVHHASLQATDLDNGSGWLAKQMPNGFGPVFAIVTKTERMARHLPSKLDLFHHATSLGGVESLIEWRAMSDAHVDQRLLRVSVGCEDWEDLRRDLERGLIKLAEEQA